jgi:hypothetical protein
LTDISVFPNRATNNLIILYPSNISSFKLEMLDTNGITVLFENKALNNATEAALAIEFLEKGFYACKSIQ